METYEYHQLLKHLYFEGYADSYEEAEDLIEEMSDEEFDFLYEEVFGIDEGFNQKGEFVRDPNSTFSRENPSHPPAVRSSPEAIRARESHREVLSRQREEEKTKTPEQKEAERQERMRKARAILNPQNSNESYEYLISYLLDEGYLSIYEANRWEKHLGIHKNTPESEFARSQHRAFHTGTPVPTNAKKPSDIEAGTLRMNRGLARMASKRNRGKSPTAPNYTHRRKIDPLKIDSWRDSPLGYPSGYSNPLGGSINISHKTKANVRPGRELLSNPLGASSNIRKFKREETEYLISYLLDEGYASSFESAEVILNSMSEGWKSNALKSIGYVAGKLAKKAKKSKFVKKTNKFLTRTALGALGVPLVF